MRLPFLFAGLTMMSLLFIFGGFCAAAPRRARREFGAAPNSPLKNSRDFEIGLCGVVFMLAAVFFASAIYLASFAL